MLRLYFLLVCLNVGDVVIEGLLSESLISIINPNILMDHLYTPLNACLSAYLLDKSYIYTNKTPNLNNIAQEWSFVFVTLI